MGWAENRILKYQNGESATWLERRMLEHANPVHFPLAVTASLGLAYGLWRHKWSWIVGSSALALLGHAYCWTRREGHIDLDRSHGISEHMDEHAMGTNISDSERTRWQKDVGTADEGRLPEDGSRER